MRVPYNKTPFATKGWAREETFHFFSGFAQPFFNVHTEIEITRLYYYARWEQISIFLAYLHAAREAACRTENFLLRMEGNQVVRYEAVDISTTVLTDDKTVAFLHLPHHADLHTFCRRASEIVSEVKKNNKLFNGYNGPDLIHATTLPWFKSNGMEHPQAGNTADTIPKLAFGRLEWKDKRVMLPVSIRIHHALADGYHIHLFLENMQASMEAAGKHRYGAATPESGKMQQLKAYLQHVSYSWANSHNQTLEGS
jgi:chloramphenicol O-acetyltransferase type A